MDRVIINSILSLDTLYDHFPALAIMAVNRYQFVTVFWNIFLVFIPLLIFLLLKKYWLETRFGFYYQKFLAFALFIIWLLFFPNTAYIITDVRHLLNYCPAGSLNRVCVDNAWMIIFFFVYSCIGWVSFYYLLKMMSQFISKLFSNLWANIFVAISIPAVALGVLLGLLNRFNSWDIFFYPILFVKVVWLYFTKLNYFIDWFIFTVFLYLLYFVGDVIFRKVKN